MSPETGTRLGAYELLSPIGRGGMGEVWRARDTQLGRDVALKLLPEELAADPDRLARFRREAQLLAALNHPNIAAIHGLEEREDTPFLVLELVEGEDLAERLRSGPLPLDEALDAAGQIAEALEEAHERGVVHRDLKPANVKLTPEGRVKVLDFGLAKAWTGELASGSVSSSSGLSESPTLAHGSTEAGLILGTAAYMAPEQARGKPVDKRCDVWAYGVLLYEMLSGRRMFEGETATDLLAAVLTRTPDFAALPATTPPRVRHLLERCLERDPKQRLRDIGEARIALAAAEPAVAEATSEETSAPGRTAHRAWLAAAAGFFVGVLALAAVLAWLRPAPEEAPVRKLDLALAGFEYNPFGGAPAISPDGERLLYHTADAIYVRDLDRLDARPLPDSAGALYSCWSPDGGRIAYIQRGRLWSVGAQGGQPSELGAVPSDVSGSGGIAWGDDGLIVVAGSDTVGLWAVPEQGGEGNEMVALDRARESDFHEVAALPGGRGVLATVHRAEGLDTIMLLAEGTREVLVQLPGESLRSPVYSPTGHLIYRRETISPGVWALPFSLDTMSASGAPFLVEPGGSSPSVARDGSLAFVRTSDLISDLVWVSQNGAIESIARLPGAADTETPELQTIDLSQDGRRAVTNVLMGGYGQLWITDLERGSTAPLLAERADSLSGVFTPDGRVVFATLLASRQWNLWLAAASGGGRPDRLTEKDAFHNPKAVSPDGRFLVLAEGVGARADLWLLPLDGSGSATPWLEAPGNQGLAASFSPDGRFLAYESDETGRSEIFVRPFPDGEGRWQATTEGGRLPAWSPSGREILYRSGDRLMSVTISPADDGLAVAAPRQLFVLPDGAGLSDHFRIAPDGRLLMTRTIGNERVALVLEWPRELERLTAARTDAHPSD